MVQQHLGEGAPGRVPHQDRRGAERAHDGLQVLHDLRDRDRLDGGRVGVSAPPPPPRTRGRPEPAPRSPWPRSARSSPPSSAASPRSRGSERSPACSWILPCVSARWPQDGGRPSSRAMTRGPRIRTSSALVGVVGTAGSDSSDRRRPGPEGIPHGRSGGHTFHSPSITYRWLCHAPGVRAPSRPQGRPVVDASP